MICRYNICRFTPNRLLPGHRHVIYTPLFTLSHPLEWSALLGKRYLRDDESLTQQSTKRVNQ